jgi:transposase
VGYDAGKKTKGSKRFIPVDVLGLLLGVDVAAADTPERAGAAALLEPARPWLCTLRKLWVDGGYSGPEFSGWGSQQAPQLEVEVIKRSVNLTGFHVLPKRWVVERTFGWLMKHRRLVQISDSRKGRRQFGVDDGVDQNWPLRRRRAELGFRPTEPHRVRSRDVQ